LGPFAPNFLTPDLGFVFYNLNGDALADYSADPKNALSIDDRADAFQGVSGEGAWSNSRSGTRGFVLTIGARRRGSRPRLNCYRFILGVAALAYGEVGEVGTDLASLRSFAVSTKFTGDCRAVRCRVCTIFLDPVSFVINTLLDTVYPFIK
jgi:hypothetical protein